MVERKINPLLIVLIAGIIVAGILAAVLLGRGKKHDGDQVPADSVKTETESTSSQAESSESTPAEVNADSTGAEAAESLPESTPEQTGPGEILTSNIFLPPGYYTIASALDPGAFLCPDNGEEGAEIQVWNELASSEAMCYIEQQTDDYYKIVFATSGMSLDVRDGSSESGAALQQRPYDGSDGQRFSLIDAGDGHIRIQSALGTYIDCADGNTEDGNPVLMVDGNNGVNQEWDFYEKGSIAMDGTIRPGIYAIAAAVSPDKVITFSNEFTAGTPCTINDWEDFPGQYVWIERQSDGWYAIWDVFGENSLTVRDGSSESGAKLELNTYVASDGQKWDIEVTDDGFFVLRSALGTVMDDAGGSLDNGTEILLCDENGNPNQKWMLLVGANVTSADSPLLPEEVGREKVSETVESGLYVIASANHEGRVMHVVGDAASDGARLELADRDDGNAFQKFFIGANEDGTFRIICDASDGRSLDVQDASTEPGAHLQMRTYDATPGQTWRIEPSSDGLYYSIRSELGTCLDCDGGSADAGTGVNMYTVTGARNQLWTLYRVG